MPVTLVLQSSAPFTNAFGGAENIGPITFTGTAPPTRQQVSVLSTGTTIAVPTPPSGAFIGVIITPPSVGGITITYSTTATSGNAINIPQGTPTVFFFDTANLPTNIYLKSGSNLASPTQIEFF